MAKYCSETCEESGAACDFCEYYDFNGDKNGAYTGDGFCRFHKMPSDPGDFCDYFVCFNIKKSKIYGGDE